MVLSYDLLAKHPRVFQTFTGLTPSEFLLFLMDFSFAWDLDEVNTLPDSFSTRKRQPGGGRKVTTLPGLEEKLLLILVYLKCYPLQAVLGFMFGMSQSRANDWVHTLGPILKHALQMAEQVPDRVASELVEALEDSDGQIAVIDGRERPRQRPTDAETQKADYRGKKKRHTKNNILLTTPEDRKVSYLSQTYAGRKSDNAIADEEQLLFPEDHVLVQDAGFQGYAPAEVIICQPMKKPKGGELPQEEKARKTFISRRRIVVEHGIGGVKRCRIVKEIFRNTKADFDDLVMELACG